MIKYNKNKAKVKEERKRNTLFQLLFGQSFTHFSISKINSG